MAFLLKQDIIWILETKLVCTTEVPGFISYHNASRTGSHRGGVMLLIRHNLEKFVVNVNMTFEGQIWLQLSLFPNIQLGGAYIPPIDSLYYDQSILANISAQLNKNKNAVILGDFNARIGTPEFYNKLGENYIYEGVCDSTVNAPGKNLITFCKDKSLVVANHLQFNNINLGGNLSFRKGNTWISEIDLCLIQEDLLPKIKSVYMNQGARGSDHAPLCISLETKLSDVLLPSLLDRSMNLGKTYMWPLSSKSSLPRTHPSRIVDINNFRSLIASKTPPIITNQNFETVLNESFRLINESTVSSKINPASHNINSWDHRQHRW